MLINDNINDIIKADIESAPCCHRWILSLHPSGDAGTGAMVGTQVGMQHCRKENTMDDIKAIERYLIGRYLQEKEVNLAEVPSRRDALLYLALREELAVMNRPLYETVILAGDKGPAFPEIPIRTSEEALKLTLDCLYGMRSVYKGGLFPGVSPEGMNRVQNVVITYKKVSDEDLQEMVMDQISWQQARKSGRPYDLEDVREDARHIRPYDNAWDLYYDEPYPGMESCDSE